MHRCGLPVSLTHLAILSTLLLVGCGDSTSAGDRDSGATSSTDATDGDSGPADPNARCRDFGPLRAFPGAEGFGAATIGGRGGQVLYVDNLNDSGPGSLRAAVETTGPRTIVFSVAGTIELQSSLRITEPYITIAGHSAPGGGIALRTADTVTSPAIVSDADEVIIQHLRVRPGASTELSNSVDAITIVGGKNIVLANSSFSWATDENINLWYDASDFTMQECISSEGLFDSTHTYQEPHSKGFIAGPDNARMSLIRNLFASNDDRNPLLQSDSPYEVVNNVIYNGYQVGTSLSLMPATQANLIGNVYLPGPNYRPSRYQVIVGAANDLPLPDAAIYVSDNISPRSDTKNDWAVMGWSGIHGGDYNGSPLPTAVRADAPFAMADAAATPIAASELVDDLLPTVGASLPTRDAVDARIVSDVQNGTGGLVDSVAEAGGWPELAAGEPTVDTDRDGLPDAWETARGLNPEDSSDSIADRDNDGYSNLEEYLACR
tara:strand:+ start:18168 stop:19643 length:1476 start_codon:yes stop_codon:yes gene_type:complete